MQCAQFMCELSAVLSPFCLFSCCRRCLSSRGDDSCTRMISLINRTVNAFWHPGPNWTKKITEIWKWIPVIITKKKKKKKLCSGAGDNHFIFHAFIQMLDTQYIWGLLSFQTDLKRFLAKGSAHWNCKSVLVSLPAGCQQCWHHRWL